MNSGFPSGWVGQ